MTVQIAVKLDDGLAAVSQLIDPESGIPGPSVSKVGPEREDRLLGMNIAEHIGPPLAEEAPVGLPAFGLEQGVGPP